MSITFDTARYKNCSFSKCELKHSKYACKIFFHYLNLSAISSFAKKYNFNHQNALLDAFRTNSRNIIGRNPSMAIPLLANQDLTPMLYRIGSCSFAEFPEIKIRALADFVEKERARNFIYRAKAFC